MWPGQVSNLGPLALESDVLGTALCSLAGPNRRQKIKKKTVVVVLGQIGDKKFT